ncbi:MAG: hypothetical protein JW821_08595 [Deltaproteobacteria bacterium]|nr:hypothetical protein [Deltaproteobacteria bacterium]
MRIWRDLPTGADVESLIRTNRASLLKKKKFLQRTQFILDPEVRELVNKINRYHQVRKDEVSNFPTRIAMLINIAQWARMTMARRGMASQAQKRMATRGLGLGDYLEGIGRRAEAKAAYFKILVNYCAATGAGELADPQDLVRRVMAAQATHGKLIGLAPGARLEGVDPIHRPWEIEMEGGRIKAGTMIEHQNLLAEWHQKVLMGECNKPLFAYLEITPHCLQADVAKDCGWVYFKGQADASAPFYLIREDQGALKMGLMNSLDLTKLTWELFDTSWITRKQSRKGALWTPVPTMAYNWLANKELVAGLHNAMSEGYYGKKHIDFHHSSFTGGQMVRCAGMIGATNGKITYLDNNSGHYKPKTEYLQRLVKYCLKRGYFAPEATVRDLGLEGLPAGEEQGIAVWVFARNPRAKPIQESLSSV